MRGEDSRPRGLRRLSSVVGSAFAEYRKRVARRAERAPKRFRGHAIIFGAANAFLLLINLVTGLSFPWFLFPLGAWAVLLADHFVLLRQRQRQVEETNAVEELSPYQTGLLRKLHRGRSAFAIALASAAGGALFLAMTNLIVSPHFPWSAITAGALGLGVLAHYFAFSSGRDRLLETLAGEVDATLLAVLRRRWPPLFHRRPGGAVEAPEVGEARRLAARIASQLAGGGGGRDSPAGEIVPLLDRYLAQIIDLVARRDEIAALERRSAPEKVRAERSRFAEKLESPQSEALRREYEKATAQLDGRLESIRRLQERREITDLRIASAINSLKQLELDAARMKSLSDVEESGVSRVLGERSRELSDYLQDLAKGQREIEELG